MKLCIVVREEDFKSQGLAAVWYQENTPELVLGDSLLESSLSC